MPPRQLRLNTLRLSALPFFRSLLMVGPAHGVIVAAVALSALLVYLATKMKRRAENKVRMSDLILRTDIQTLAKSNSQLLDDAIALRYAQMEQGRNPGD